MTLLRHDALATGALAVEASDMPSAGPPAAVEPLMHMRPLVAVLRGPGALRDIGGLC